MTATFSDIAPLLGQIGLGGLLGFAVGFALKKVGTIVLVVLGCLVLLLQLAAMADIIQVNWLRIQEVINPWLEPDSLDATGRSFVTMLVADLPFAGSFLGMLAVGFKAG